MRTYTQEEISAIIADSFKVNNPGKEQPKKPRTYLINGPQGFKLDLFKAKNRTG